MMDIRRFAHHDIIMGMDVVVVQVGSDTGRCLAETIMHNGLGEDQHIARLSGHGY